MSTVLSQVREIVAIKLDGDELERFMIQLGYVESVSDAIKGYGSMDTLVAMDIMKTSLGAADVCKDLWGRVYILGQELYGTYKSEEAKAQLQRSSYSTHVQQKVDAQRDSDCINARNSYIKMETCASMLKMKYDILMATHYMCRSIVGKAELNTSFLSEADGSIMDNL